MNLVKTIFNEFPSELEEEQLVANRLEMLRRDIEWREKWVDLERASDLYEQKSSGRADGLDASYHNDIPRVNLIRRAVEDYISVAFANIPKAELTGTKNILYTRNPIEREIIRQVRFETEKNINAFVKTIQEENDYQDLIEKIIRQSAIYGVGYMKIEIDRTADIRKSFQLKELLAKPFNQWSEEDAKKYEVLTKRISLKYENSEDVYWQYGRKIVDEDMMRVSIVERADVDRLRNLYGNEKIKAGRYPYYIEEDPTDESTIAAVITTWELEDIHIIKGEGIPNQQGGGAYFFGKQLIKTVIAGGELIEKKVIEPLNGQIELPIVPVYLRESEKHPYGFSVPLMLELSEEFINLMRIIIYKSAKNAVSLQGVLVAMQNLTPGDMTKVNNVLANGGVAQIEGNFDGPVDIRQTVMPLSYNQSNLSPAAIQAMTNEERMFQTQSQTLDEQAIARAESGMAKRAQILANDRPKTISLNLLSHSIEKIHEMIYDLIRIHYRDEINVEINRTDQGRSQVRLNEPVSDVIPAMDEEGNVYTSESYVTNQNPMGVVPQEIQYKLNDTTLNLKAVAEGRKNLPIDPYARFNQLITYFQTGIITRETLRQLSLDDELKAIDDRNREIEREQQLQMLLDMMTQQRNQSNGLGQTENQNIGIPTEMTQSVAPQEISQDQEQMANLSSQLGLQ